MKPRYHRITSRIIILLALGLCLASTARAQFTEVTAISLTSVSGSSAAWGDYDNDGDLDILVTGSYTANIYRNDEGTFVDINAGLTGVTLASVAWGDYDNDGDLDILLTGKDSATPTYIAKVYRNEAGTFVDIEAGLPAGLKGEVAWGDYDNDGDLDILLSTTSYARIYRNDGGIFTTTDDLFFSSTSYGKTAVAWGDYDNDGDLDVVVTDWSTGSKIYENDGGSFTAAVTLVGVWDAAVAWGDYDNDGDLDLLLTGNNNETLYTVLYENNVGVFSGHYVGTTGLTNLENASVAWGDYDNDGDLDILLSGYTGSSTFTGVYSNDGDGTFTDIGAGLPNVSGGSAVWGDYDHDGRLDILLTGSGNATVYQNTDEVLANNLPTAPTGLQADVYQDSVQLTWTIATDIETDNFGLSYNLRVGTTSGGEELMSAHADSATGYRLIPALGNAQENLYGWWLYNLADDTLYWSVQSIDHAWAGSAFSLQDTFEIAVPPATPQNLAVGTYYDIGTAPLKWSQNVDKDILRYRVYMDSSAVPTTLVDSTDASGDTTITITGLTPDTTYYFRIKAVDEGGRESFEFSNEVTTTPAQYSMKTDSSALADLYKETGGANWTTKWDLDVALERITNTTSTWGTSVVVTNGRVTRVRLTNNNMTGTVPASIGDLVNLEWLYLDDNQLTAIPDAINNLTLLTRFYLRDNLLTDLPDLTALSGYIYVENNKLTFEDIVPNFASLYRYAPQDSVGVAKDTTVEAGTSLTISVSVWGGADNYYQWYKNGSYLSNATDDTLTFDPVSEADSGSYVCWIKNSNAPYLTLKSRPNHVTVINKNAPAAPQNLVADAVAGSVTLTWNKNTEADFLRYRIYSGTAANPTTWDDSTSSITDTSNTTTDLTNGITYYFRVTAVDVALNESGYSNEVNATPILSISDQDALPTAFALRQNYPNPFNPSTTVKFEVPAATELTVVVYDLLGRKVVTLVEGAVQPGYHRVIWNGKAADGSEVPTGIYIARLVTPEYTKSIKMVLLK